MVEGRGSGGIICRYHPPMKKKYIDNKKNIPFITKEQFKHLIASYIDREILIKYMFFENNKKCSRNQWGMTIERSIIYYERQLLL
jgi:hypothetical protein